MQMTSRMCRTALTLAATAALCCAPALAQMQGQGSGSMQQSNPSQGSMQQQQQQMGAMNQNQMNSSQGMADKAFLKTAMQGGMAEVQMAQLALQKSSNAQVKQFAQRMVDDHTKMNEQAKSVAQQVGVQVPKDVSKKDKSTMAKLQGLSGDAFDKAYMQDTVKDHTQDDKDFKTEAMNGQGPVKDLATQAEPIISSHLQVAKQVAQSVGASSM